MPYIFGLFVQNIHEHEWLCQEHEKLVCGKEGELSNADKAQLAIEMLR